MEITCLISLALITKSTFKSDLSIKSPSTFVSNEGTKFLSIKYLLINNKSASLISLIPLINFTSLFN